jgi:hypothetical protein
MAAPWGWLLICGEARTSQGLKGLAWGGNDAIGVYWMRGGLISLRKQE